MDQQQIIQHFWNVLLLDISFCVGAGILLAVIFFWRSIVDWLFGVWLQTLMLYYIIVEHKKPDLPPD